MTVECPACATLDAILDRLKREVETMRQLLNARELFPLGTRVRMTKEGEDGLNRRTRKPNDTTGVVIGYSPRWPESIRVQRDHRKTSEAFSCRYWRLD